MSSPLILIVDDNKELADLLAQIFEDAGYRSRTSYRGRLAIDAIERERPALAVVDLLLPDLMGYEVAKTLRAKEIPFFFVTGVFKGAKHSFEAKNRYGSQGWFEKPFEANRLLRAVQEIVAPSRQRATPETFDVELDIDIDEKDYTPLAPLEMTGRIAVKGSSVQAVLTGADFTLQAATTGQKLVRPPPLGAPAAPPPLPAEVVSPDGRSRRGVLADNLPQLIAAFWQLQETGELGLQRGRVKKLIYFEKGLPVFALSNLAADRFGTFLTRVGKISEEQLHLATHRAITEKRRTGDVLIEMGLLQDAERMYYVAQQVKSILYSTFAWQEGHYVMTFLSKARQEPIRLGIHPAQLITRGIKKLYSPSRQRRLIALEDRLIPSEDPAFQIGEVELDVWEASLLAKVDGHRTVAELIAVAGRPESEVYAALVTFVALKLVEKRG